LYEARRILGDTRTGIHDGVAASGPSGLVASGPLADGVFTLDEWRALVLHTAQPRPVEGRDDGDINFVGGPEVPQYPTYGVGENPYCQLCFTLPVRWTDVPDTFPAYTQIGYGAINECSVALADAVLAGVAPMPDRSDVDAFFAASEQIRHTTWGR
jgi:hypothetical protein